MKKISYFFIGMEYVLCKVISYLLVLCKGNRTGNCRNDASIYFRAVFCNKKYVFDSMGNIKGLSGLLWFLLIVCLTPIEFKRDGIMGVFIISALALLNIFSDIFKYKYSFMNEKRSVIILWSFLPLCVLCLYILIIVGMK